ncbi:MAG TPA: ankyrin repeat domain-containing protein, partial [Candidatus Rifleibacterium sp.]|nr:ankyrin repeat domain-containing protein [Candidatus Rifleibacterium sp.]
EHYDVLALLLEYGVLLDRRDDSGNTALMHAVEDGSIEAVKALIAAGADTNLKNEAGLTLQQIAADADEPELVEFFKHLNGGSDQPKAS